MIDGVCTPRPNGYMDQVDCAVHGTPWHEDDGCEVTEESWAEYVRSQSS